MNTNEHTATEPSTTASDYFQELIEESNRLKVLIDTAKTSLKKAYYEKKLDKIKQKAYKTLVSKVMQDPSLLKKAKEDEQV